MHSEALEGLDPLATSFARILFERYPDWKPYVVPPDNPSPQWNGLIIEVPSRFPGRPLRIEAGNGGILISWRGWHAHYDDWGDSYTEEQFITEALETIRGLLSEELVIIEAGIYDRVQAAGGYTPDRVDEALLEPWYANYTDVTATSWNGTYDRRRPENR